MVKRQLSKNTVKTRVDESGDYARLCALIDVSPAEASIDLSSFVTKETMAECDLNERLNAALGVLIAMLSDDGVGKGKKRIDKVLLNHYIARLDRVIAHQMNEILHHADFQHCESLWRGVKYLVDQTNFSANIKLELWDVDKETLREDLEEASDITQSALYQHVYTAEYDTPGGEPISAMISNYAFDSSARDVALLGEISKVSAAAHCPFIGSVGAPFFHKKNMDEVNKMEDFEGYMDRAEYVPWNRFRDSADARYIGLVFPRFLLRLPYGEQNPIKPFFYEESVIGEGTENYLWGSAAFAFAANLVRSFERYGWAVNIRGPESGGKVERLPLHRYDVGVGPQTKIPSETIISETRELAYANHGFIPLSFYKNTDFACFFSANSVQRPVSFLTPEATANSRINARLPYIFLSSRLGHYLKVLQRENIGANKNRKELERELNAWLQTLVTKMNEPSPELIATHPLRDGCVVVKEIADNPGFYSVTLHVTPHFQIEGVDVRLSLVGRLPRQGTRAREDQQQR